MRTFLFSRMAAIRFISYDEPAYGWAATIEAVKTVADVYAPISGEIIDSNQSLLDTPELINSNPFDNGWIIKMTLDDSESLPEFMTEEEYENFINK